MNNYTDTSETMITVKWWCVIVLIIGIFGFFFLGFINHESRITKIETQVEAIYDVVQDIKADTTKIKDKLYEK